MSAQIFVYCKKHEVYVVDPDGKVKISHPFDLRNEQNMWCPYSTKGSTCSGDPNNWKFIIV